MKQLYLFALLILVSLSGRSQTQPTLPSGSLPYGNQTYIDPSGGVWVGTTQKQYRRLGTRSEVDSLAYTKAQSNATFVSIGPGITSYAPAAGSTDLNTITGNNVFYGAGTTTNVPVTGFAGMIQSYGRTNLYSSQSAIANINDGFYYRSQNNGVWNPWLQVASTNYTNNNFIKLGIDGAYTGQRSALDMNTVLGNNVTYTGGDVVNGIGSGIYQTYGVTANFGAQLGLSAATVGINGDGLFYRNRVNGVWGNWFRGASREWVATQIPAAQTLSSTGIGGNIAISGGNTLNLNSLNLQATNVYPDASVIPSGAGLYPYNTTTGSTGYPSPGTSGIKMVRSGGTALGAFEFNKPSSTAGVLYYRVGNGANSYTDWETIASQQYLTTYGNNNFVGTSINTGGAIAGAVLDANTITNTSRLYASSGSTNRPVANNGVITTDYYSSGSGYASQTYNGITSDSYWYRAILNGSPTDWFQAASRQWANSTFAPLTGGNYLPLTGGTLTGQLNGVGARFSSNLALGPSNASTVGFYNTLPIQGATTSYGNYTVSEIQPTVTTAAFGYRTNLSVAPSLALPSLYHYTATPGVIGSGGSITTQIGFTVDNMVNAASNVAFAGRINNDVDNWNLYMSGSAKNFLSGSLGVGTSRPTEKLEVNGNTKSVGSIESTFSDQSLSRIIIGNTASGGSRWAWVAGINAVSQTGFSLYSYGANSSRMTVLDNGNIGFGTNTPAEKLEVLGNAKATNFIGNLSGNATTATTLQTSRTINGVAFNGSQDINITDSSKEPVVSAGANTQYYRGDKTWQTLNTTNVPEGTNLYYTNTRVLAAPLTGFSTSTNTAVIATDNILVGLGKLQAQINARPGTVTSVSSTVAGNALNVPSTPITSTGTLAYTWAGNSSQYVNGAGNLTTFPSPVDISGKANLVGNNTFTGDNTLIGQQSVAGDLAIRQSGYQTNLTGNYIGVFNLGTLKGSSMDTESVIIGTTNGVGGTLIKSDNVTGATKTLQSPNESGTIATREYTNTTYLPKTGGTLTGKISGPDGTANTDYVTKQQIPQLANTGTGVVRVIEIAPGITFSGGPLSLGERYLKIPSGAEYEYTIPAGTFTAGRLGLLKINGLINYQATNAGTVIFYITFFNEDYPAGQTINITQTPGNDQYETEFNLKAAPRQAFPDYKYYSATSYSIVKATNSGVTSGTRYDSSLGSFDFTKTTRVKVGVSNSLTGASLNATVSYLTIEVASL